jgi:hypothetical protein
MYSTSKLHIRFTLLYIIRFVLSNEEYVYTTFLPQRYQDDFLYSVEYTYSTEYYPLLFHDTYTNIHCFLEGNNAVFIRVQAALEGFHHFQHRLIDKGCVVIRGIERWVERAGGEKLGGGERCRRGAAIEGKRRRRS